MYTVCGHAHPHQTRPASAVSRKTVMTMLASRNISSSVSVGRNVVPNNVNWRRGRSRSTSGFPFIRRYGMMKNTNISTYATERRRCQNFPGDGLGRIQRREPSSLSVGRTRPTAAGALALIAGARRLSPCGALGLAGLVPCSAKYT